MTTERTRYARGRKVTVLATATAWDLIGFGGNTDDIRHLPGFDGLPEDTVCDLRVVGGWALYEAADNFGGSLVRLARVEVRAPRGVGVLAQVNRYVDPDTRVELVA